MVFARGSLATSTAVSIAALLAALLTLYGCNCKNADCNHLMVLSGELPVGLRNPLHLEIWACRGAGCSFGELIAEAAPFGQPKGAETTLTGDIVASAQLGSPVGAERWNLTVRFADDNSTELDDFTDGERVFLRVVDLERRWVDVHFETDVEYEEDSNGPGCSTDCKRTEDLSF